MDLLVSYTNKAGEKFLDVPLKVFKKVSLMNLVSWREIRSYKGQHHKPGFYWFKKLGIHVRYESQFEELILIELDFTQPVTWILSQPFALAISNVDGIQGTLHHTPDFLVRLSSGSWKLINVRPLDLQRGRDTQIKFEAAHQFCSYLGIGYETRSELNETYQENLSWLAGFSRPPANYARISLVILDFLATGPKSIGQISTLANEPWWTRPVLFHMIWKGILTFDYLVEPLRESTMIQIKGIGGAYAEET